MRHTEQFRHAEHPVEKEIGIVIIKEDFSRLPFEDFFVFLHDNSLQTLLYMISRLFQTTKIQIFSKQFTTSFQILVLFVLLFQTTKIQIFSKQSQIQGNQANNGYNCYGLDVLHKSYLKASIILIQSISETYCYLIKKRPTIYNYRTVSMKKLQIFLFALLNAKQLYIEYQSRVWFDALACLLVAISQLLRNVKTIL